MRSLIRIFIRWALLLPLLLPLTARAETARKQLPAIPEWEPQVFVATPEGIGLLKAVQWTLEQDPNLLLRTEEARTREGFSLELAGAFDWIVNGQASWDHREQKLRQSAIDFERDKRRQIADVQAVACDLESDLATELDDLARAQTSTGVDITTDAGFNAQLRLLEAAILAADNAIVRQSLERTRANLITTEIDLTTMALAEARQACSRAGEDLQRLGRVPEEEEFDIGRLELRAEKLSRSGILFGPFLRWAYDSTDFIGKRRGFLVPALDPQGRPLVSPSGIPLERLIDFGGKNIEDLHTFDLGFEVNLPLLRGRGRNATGAAATAAEIDFQASELVLEHSASESVLNTAFAYWNLVAAQERVRILETSVTLQESLVGTAQALVDAEELPAAELARGRAGEANARAQLLDARRNLTTAQIDLVRAMGLTVSDPLALPVAGDPFPPAPEREGLLNLAETLLKEALDRRLDLQATRSLVDSGLVLSEAAATDLRPRLDLTAAGWWTARGEGSPSAALDRTASEPSWRLRAQLEKPLGNRTFKGRLIQQQALLGQRRVSEADLARLIRVAVVRTLGSLAEGVDQLRYAESAAEAFEQTVGTEMEKLKVGETSIIDANLTEQQRTEASLAVVFARLQVATLLAQLRFETGTLVEHDAQSGDNKVTEDSLRLLPGRAGA